MHGPGHDTASALTTPPTPVRSRALAEHEKSQAYPEAVETAHADFAALQQRDSAKRHLAVETSRCYAVKSSG